MVSPGQDTEERAWNAVLARDARAEGRFVYAVVTTGVYCRPSCPARRPLRRNVRFFATAEEARRAGFRACRRCRPDAGDGSGQGAARDELVERALGVLERCVAETLTLEELGAAVGASPFHLQRRFKERTGMSPKEYVTALRLAGFRGRVRAGEPVAQAAYAAGFGSSRGLYVAARAGLGMTPGQYARRGRGLEIAWALASCELGRVAVAATPAGVCGVLLGEDDSELARELGREFEAARLVPGAAPRGWVESVVRHLDDTHSPVAVPLDYRGTPFQVRVWRALREIPAGERRSYSELAAAVGAPRAVRAVGTACARNAIAVLVPCHRAVRKDGSLGGYRWGVQRKAALLAREAGQSSM